MLALETSCTENLGYTQNSSLPEYVQEVWGYVFLLRISTGFKEDCKVHPSCVSCHHVTSLCCRIFISRDGLFYPESMAVSWRSHLP